MRKYTILFIGIGAALAALLGASRADAAVSYVQSTRTQVSASSQNISFSSTPTPGNLVLVSIGSIGSSTDATIEHGMVTSVTDNQGNIYKQLGSQAMLYQDAAESNPHPWFSVYYAYNVSSTGTFTVSVNTVGANAINTALEEVSGVTAVSPLDAQAEYYGRLPSSTTASYGSVTSRYNGELFFMAQMHVTNFATVTTTAPTGFTVHQSTTEAFFQPVLSIADAVLNATTTSSTFSYSLNTPGVWGMIVGTFKAAASKSGYLDSPTFDTGVASGTQLNSVAWGGSQPGGTSVGLQIAVSNTSSGPWSYLGTDGTSNTYFTGNVGTTVTLSPYATFVGYRYFRYRATLFSNSAGTLAPRVDDVLVNVSP